MRAQGLGPGGVAGLQGAVVLATLFCTSLPGGRPCHSLLQPRRVVDGWRWCAFCGLPPALSAVGKHRLPVVNPFLLEMAAWSLFS